MKKTPIDQGNSRCVIYVGGDPWEITNIHTQTIAGMEHIVFTKPDGTECINYRGRDSFGDGRKGAEIAIALSLNGYTETTWGKLTEERRKEIRERARKILSTVGEEGMRSLYG